MLGSRSGRVFAWFVALVVGALLPFASPGSVTPAAQADVPVFDGKEIKDLCTIGASGQNCPVFPPPPPLLNAGAVAAAGPAVAASLQKFQDQAVTNTLTDHGLPESDREAVISWARDDAEAELWALIVEALETSAGARTTDQANVVSWMNGLASAQANDAAIQVGEEYTTWAGLDVAAYHRIARTATKDQLTTFLASDVRTFSPLFTPRGGYCRYTAPDPYSDDYDGSTAPTCSAPCPSVAGCPIPTPKYDEFVKWGQAAASNHTLSDPNLTSQAAQIAEAALYGAAGIAAAIVVTSALTTAITSSFVMAAIFTAGVIEGEVVGGAAIGTLAGVGAVAAAVLVVILAIVISVLEGIRVSDNAALPGKIAEFVVNARTTVTDATTLIDTDDGATSLFNMFVGATMPRPRYDVACDNSLIPPWAYTSSFDPNLLIYVPLGENKAIISPANREGCLNPPPIPPSAPSDGHFLVQRDGSGTPQVASSITIGGDPSGTTQQVRLSGNWFVDKIAQPGTSTRTWQSLSLDYNDWDGVGTVAWLVRGHDGNQRFIGAKSDADATTLDPDTCQADGTCWESDTIQYVGTDGHNYSASIEQPAAATGQPTYSPTEPLEGSPVTFDAADFEPPSSDHQVDYSWRFQQLGCGWLECFRPGEHNPDGSPVIAYDGPFTGKTATYTWDSIGPAKVELTATDHHGHSATTVFIVDVGNVAPTAQAIHENEATVGQPVTMQGSVRDSGADDDLNIVINYGDGTTAATKVGPNSIPLLDPSITRVRLTSDAWWGILATHTYTQPGIYYGTYTVSDWGGGTDFDTFFVKVTGKQQVSLPAVGDQVYGSQLAPATGSPLSGVPVTYTAGPDTVCQPSDDGQAVDLVGVGACTVAAHQAANPPMYLAADPVSRTFDVEPAPLTIKAKVAQKVYGAANPAFGALYTGLVNGDTEDDFPGLVFDAPPAGAGVGDYTITPSGATNPNYDITYATGTMKIKPAELVVVVLDYTRPYGSENPAFSWAFNGLVNGDTRDDIPGITVEPGPPVGAPPGEYFVDASGAVNPNYDIFYSKGTVTVTRAPLTITADDQDQVYGADDPSYSASFDGLVNGDTEDDFPGLTFAGPPIGSDVGDYDITASGAANPNYDIGYATGTQHVTPAPLTVTADDKTSTYGGPNPELTAKFDGLVNGDTRADVPGLVLTGPPPGSEAGKHPITPSGAANANYDVDFVAGTQTILPASLTVRPFDVATASGTLPSYAWTGDGWVNGDTDATFSKPGRTAPTCVARVNGSIVSTSTSPGDYPDAVTCTGARDDNYAIDYSTADLRVDPVISLRQSGLPASVARRVTLDGMSVELPLVARQVRLGSSHTYSYPKVLADSSGTTYVTSVAAFSGVVNANIDVTATYLTMSQVLQQAQTTGGLTRKEVDRLTLAWSDVQATIKRGRNVKAQDAVSRFAATVRRDVGTKLTPATAQVVLAYAQAVYAYVGGTGPI